MEKESHITYLHTFAEYKAKACNPPHMQYYFKWFFVLHSSEVIFSFPIKESRRKAVVIESAFFHSVGNPRGRTLDNFFYASHIRHNFPCRLIPISLVNLNISEVINGNSTGALNYLGDFKLVGLFHPVRTGSRPCAHADGPNEKLTYLLNKERKH